MGHEYDATAADGVGLGAADAAAGSALLAVAGLEVECLRGLLELSSKAQTLSTLERESADLPVESAEPADKQLSAADVKRAELLAAVEAHNQKGGA